MIRILRRAAYVPHIRSIGKKEPRRTDYQSGQYFIHNEYDYKGIILYQGEIFASFISVGKYHFQDF